MTMFATYLLAETNVEPGDDWWDRSQRLMELRGRGGWELLLGPMKAHEATVLDWGAHLYAVPKDEILALYTFEEPLPWQAETLEQQREALEALPDGEYGLAVVEIG